MFQPRHGTDWWVAVALALVFCGVLTIVLQQTPIRLRRPLVMTITFLAGLFFVLEFFLPVHPQPSPQDPSATGNFLTPLVGPVGKVLPVITAWTVGMGVVNLCQAHSKRILRGSPGYGNSIAFFVSMIAMLLIGLLATYHPNAINKNWRTVLFDGALQSLDATMFSIIAFYIVSASYRAFRVRSVEATLLLITAVIVMLGQTVFGQWLTGWLPHDGFWHNLRIEIVRDWILTKANTPATRAIAFGLGIGALAVALRIWLGLERGSYFDQQG